MSTLFLAVLAVALALTSDTALAANVEVQAQVIIFSPDIVFVNPGDTVSFRHMPTHQVQSVATMTPTGAPPMESRFGTDYDYKADKEGIYVYRCATHWPGRMGGIIVVGKPANAKATIGQYKTAAQGYDSPARALLEKLETELPKHGM